MAYNQLTMGAAAMPLGMEVASIHEFGYTDRRQQAAD